MLSRYAFSKQAIEQFEIKYNIPIVLSLDQSSMIEDKGKTQLSIDQLRGAAEGLAGSKSLDEFVIEYSKKHPTFSVSLYVYNDALWKMMKKKSKNPEMMLPMITIPYFYWNTSAVNPKNPTGACRDTEHLVEAIVEQNDYFVIRGTGGDFCGVLESRVVALKRAARPILAPTIPGPIEHVPKYEAQMVEVKLSFGNIRKNLNPNPDDRADYSFSEHPRVFYEHGFALNLDGGSVNLRVGKRKSTKLSGEVVVYIGKKFQSMNETEEVIAFHSWLVALYDLIF